MTPSARSWRRAQAMSGVCLAVFVIVHLVNLPLAAVEGAYDTYQRVVRAAYQSPFVEIPFVILPLLVHVVAGVRAILWGQRAPARTWPARLHRCSGWYLLLVVGGHVLATRGASLVYGVYPESVGLGFALAWIPWLFWPYFVLLALSGVAHVGYGLPRALATLRERADHSAASRPLGTLIVVAMGLMLVGLLGLGGLLHATTDVFASRYAGIYRAMDDSPFVPDVPEPR